MRVNSSSLLFLLPLFAFAAPRAAAGTEIREKTVIVGMEDCCAPEAWPAAENLLAREFRALGFSVLLVPGRAQGERDRRLELQDLTEAHAAACAVRIVRPVAGQGAVELWVNDRVTRKMLFRQFEIPSEVGEREAEIIALRIVEMLRASLLELRLPERSPRGKDAPPPTPRTVPPAIRRLLPETPAPSPDRIALELHGGAWISSGGVPALGMLHLGLRVRLPAALALLADVGFSPISGELGADGLVSTFDMTQALAWVLWSPEPAGALRPSFGVGAGLLRPSARGVSGSPGLTLRQDATVVGAGAVRFELAWTFTARLAVICAVNAGVALPEITVRFSERTAARAGNPFAEVLAGLRIHFF
jgi:hypothetical protein